LNVFTYGIEPTPKYWWKRIALAATLAALALVSILLLKPYVEQAQYLRIQWRISHHLLPPGTVIYTEDPARIATLAQLPQLARKIFFLTTGIGVPRFGPGIEMSKLDVVPKTLRPTLRYSCARYVSAPVPAIFGWTNVFLLEAD
jgi:hypothetical protein